jgi:phosphoribosylanthranilate isomerase
VETVVVTRHPAPTFARGVCRRVRPDWLQTDAQDFADIQLPEAVRALPVYRDEQPPSPLPKRLLFEGANSGTGQTCDWGRARSVAAQTQLVLAGGLNPDNVADAVTQVRPFGVDVSSGVERERGQKDIDKIHQFVAAARAAAAQC